MPSLLRVTLASCPWFDSMPSYTATLPGHRRIDCASIRSAIAACTTRNVRPLSPRFLFRMNDTPSIYAETPADNSFRKSSRAAVVFVTLYAWYFSPLGAFGFIGAHQPRYPRIAREMAKSGDWVTPRH